MSLVSKPTLAREVKRRTQQLEQSYEEKIRIYIRQVQDELQSEE